MFIHPILLLGYPIHRIAPDSLEEAIGHLIEEYKRAPAPSFATTLNGLLIGQLSTINLNRRTYPEVVETLRQTNFVGLDSHGLKLISKLLGNEVNDLITSEELLRSTASYLAKKNKSMYLIGGEESISKKVAQALQEDYPGLKIAGIASPGILTKGVAIEETFDRDPYVIDAINSAKPTVLVLELGHPKLELWFESIKEDLKVPLCIGVGGGYERYLVQRDPDTHPEKNPFQWQQVRRRLLGALHYSCWLPPLFLYNTLNRLIHNISQKFKTVKESESQLFLSQKESLTVLSLPPLLDHSARKSVLDWLEGALEHDHIVLDFRHVGHIDLAGFGLLYTVWKRSHALNKNLFLIGISSDLRWLIKLHGAWDLLSHHICKDPEEVLDRMSMNLGVDLKNDREFVSIHQIDHATVLSVFGRLHGIAVYPNSFKQLAPVLEFRGCIVDLTYCTAISLKGFAFLLKLQNFVRVHKQDFTLTGVCRKIKHQFKQTKLLDTFQFG